MKKTLVKLILKIFKKNEDLINNYSLLDENKKLNYNDVIFKLPG